MTIPEAIAITQPCPCCNVKPKFESFTDKAGPLCDPVVYFDGIQCGFSVDCVSCGFAGPARDSETEAIEAWNENARRIEEKIQQSINGFLKAA